MTYALTIKNFVNNKYKYTPYSLRNGSGGKMKKNKTKSMVLHALFIAIEMLLIFVPFLGYIPIGPLRATTLHIPVIIAGIVLGKKSGAIIGLSFGIISLLYNTMNPTITSFVFSPFISGNVLSIVIAIIPRVLIGFIAGWIYEKLQTKKIQDIVSMSISSIMGALTNTILVLGGIYIIFGASYAKALSINYQELMPWMLGIITSQGILEAIVGTIIAVLVSKTLIKVMK